MSTEAANAIAVIVEANPALVLVDDKKFEDFYEHVRSEAKAMKIDLSTDKGRKAIASMAHKIARTKTAIDDAGKKLNEESRQKINAVDEARRKIRERFDVLKEEVRKPLTDWEAVEDARIQRVAEIRGALAMTVKDLLANQADGEAIQNHLTSMDLIAFDAAAYGEDAEALKELLATVREQVAELLAKVRKEESDRAELERLRAEAIERDRREQERLAAEDAARRAKEEEDARNAEESRLAKEAEERRAKEEARQKADQERIEREAKERAEREAQERIEAAEQAARAAQEKAAQEAQEQIDAAKRAAADAEAARIKSEQEAERRLQEERAAREREKAEQERVDREQREADAKRQADREHRAKIMGAAKAAIIEIGIEEPQARELVLAITAGNIPNVSIKF
jgi:colicin import membrane protein